MHWVVMFFPFNYGLCSAWGGSGGQVTPVQKRRGVGLTSKLIFIIMIKILKILKYYFRLHKLGVSRRKI